MNLVKAFQKGMNEAAFSHRAATIRVITNRKPRQLIDFIDLPKKDQDDFSYLLAHDWDTPRFVQYKGCWYDVFDTLAIHGNSLDADSPLVKWDAAISDTAFSATVFKLTEANMVI